MKTCPVGDAAWNQSIGRDEGVGTASLGCTNDAADEWFEILERFVVALSESLSSVKNASRAARCGWLCFDALVVVVFVVIGRSTHHHVMTWSGFASTAWPFVVGLLIGWVWVLARGRAGATLTSGVVVWLCTVVVGMLLRVEFGQGTAVAFIAVALGFLGALMLGARLVARSARARSSRPI
jgi:Protein of unknown function (DUF3054)